MKAATCSSLQKADGAGLNTVQFAQKKARHSAFYKQPSKAAADQLKTGDLSVLAFPDAFPNQGGLPIQVDGQTIGGLGVSGAPSEVDEAIGHVALDALKQDRPPGLSIRLTRGPTLFASFARERPINNRPAGYQPAPQQMAKVQGQARRPVPLSPSVRATKTGKKAGCVPRSGWKSPGYRRSHPRCSPESSATRPCES